METQEELAARFAGCPHSTPLDKSCACPADCPLHGNCCACVTWHRDYANKPLPYCLRTLEEVTWQTRQS